MSISVTIEETRVLAGEVVRGTVEGLDRWPDTRGVVVALVHDVKHLDRQAAVEVPVSMTPGLAPSLPFEIRVPPDATPSFEGRHYRSAWRVEARVDLPRRRDETASRDLVVMAAPTGPSSEVEPLTAEAAGVARFRIFAAVFLIADLGALAALYVALGTVPPPIALAFVVPAAVTLLALAWLGLRPGPVERLRISVPRERWRLGEEVPVRVDVTGEPGGFESLEVALRGEEVWVESSGKTTHERRAVFHEDIQRWAAADVAAARTAARRWSWDWRFVLPAQGPASVPKKIEWSARARAAVPRRPDPTARIVLEVSGSRPIEAAD